jgi:hypothetical protein
LGRSDHHQLSSTPNPDPSAGPDATDPPSGSRPGISLSPDDETLMKMQRDFPGHRIWQEIIPGRAVYVARSRHPAARPHTVITPDLRELLTALAEASQPGGTP